MIDLQANAGIVNQLKATLEKARLGKIKAIAIATIEADGSSDAIIEMHREPMLIPAIIGSMQMLMTDLHLANKQAETIRQIQAQHMAAAAPAQPLNGKPS